MATPEIIKRWHPIVSGVLSLIGVPEAVTGGISALKGVADLSPHRIPELAGFVSQASDNLAQRPGSEHYGLSGYDAQAIEFNLGELLRGNAREQLLSSAVLGYEPFRELVLRDAIFDGMGEAGHQYVTNLLVGVHGLISQLALKPEFYPAASVQAIRTIQCAVETRPTTEQVQQMVDALRAKLERRPQQIVDALGAKLERRPQQIVDALGAELERRPKQLVMGDRPVLAKHWVEREELRTLAEALSDGGLATVCALKGMRGAGKSQLAAAFAQECENAGWPFVGWATASTREQAILELSGFAFQSGIAPVDVSPDDAVQHLRTWLAEARDEGRLLVLDNVEDISDVRDLLPRGRGMRVILTSTQHIDTLGTPVNIGTYSPEQAINFLVQATGVDDRHGATTLAEDLDRLPVALSQAAVAMDTLGVGYSGLGAMLNSNELDAVVEPDTGSGYPVKVGRTLRLAYTSYLERLALSDPVQAQCARDVLGALSLLSASGTPRDWLYVLGQDELVGRRAVGGLLKHSLLVEAGSEQVVALHRLQSQVLREDDAAHGTADRSVEAAAKVLIGAEPPEDGDYMARREALKGWVEALALVLGQPHSNVLAERRSVLSAAARAAYRADQEGDPYSTISLGGYVDVCERVLGSDHPDTLTSRNNLAGAYESAGDLDRAIPLYEQTLADRVRVLGPDHPDTLTSRNNLAYAYRSAGDLDRAIPLYEQTLTDRVRVLGPDHPDTLTSRNNLAYAYESAGDLDRAIPLYEQTLTDRVRVLGPDHPDTLTSRNNLAGAYEPAGDLDRAIPLFEQTLTDSVRVLGPDHPDTLTSRNNLAYAYRSAGDLDRAIPLFEQTLTDRVRVLGPDHPDTLTSRNNLAGAWWDTGNRVEAAAEFAEAAELALRLFGPEHEITRQLVANAEHARVAPASEPE